MPKAGSIWIEANFFHFIDADGLEWSVQGLLVGPAKPYARMGEIGYNSATGAIHFIGLIQEPQTAKLYEYKLPYETGFSGSQTPATGIIASAWVEASGYLHWLTEGKTEARTYSGIEIPETAPYAIPPDGLSVVTLEAWYRPGNIIDGSDWPDDTANAHDLSQGTPALELEVVSNALDGHDGMDLMDSITKRLATGGYFQVRANANNTGFSTYAVCMLESGHTLEARLTDHGPAVNAAADPGHKPFWFTDFMDPPTDDKYVLFSVNGYPDPDSTVCNVFTTIENARGLRGRQANTVNFDYMGYRWKGVLVDDSIFKNSCVWGIAEYNIRQWYKQEYPSLTLQQPTEKKALSSFSELLAHWEAANCTYDGGNLISQVTDSSGGGHTMTQGTAANKLKYIASPSQWDKPSMAARGGSGTNSYLSETLWWVNNADWQDYTVVIVSYFDHSSSGSGVWYPLGSSSGYFGRVHYPLYTGNVNQIRTTYGSFFASGSNQGVWWRGCPVVTSMSYRDNGHSGAQKWSAYLNGFLLNRADNSDGPSVERAEFSHIGDAYSTFSAGLDSTDYLSHIGEIAVIGRSLTDQEHMNVAWALLNDYGISSHA